MKTPTLRVLLVILGIMLGLQSSIVLGHNSLIITSNSALLPQPIRQGPLQATYALGGYYWFQIGAIGDSNSYNVDGASITIRTVYDQVRNDAHSYWVGTLLVTGGFVQVGYLNGLSTTGQPYCCAWFFETFYTPNCDCPPIIGPEGSAGPIGSWHTYSMVHTSNGVWSFYMDGNLLGNSPPPSDKNYLGAGATNSGNQAPAGIAEVAQATDNKDIIGPTEFKDLEIRQTGLWHQMTNGVSHCCYGYSSQTGLPNLYGVAEVEGLRDDFLAGSNIRQPSSATTLWPTSVPSSIKTSFNFIDRSGGPFTPDWISLQDLGNGNVIYYTGYAAQDIPPSSSGTYRIIFASWHGVNVVRNSLASDSATSQTIQGDVFSIPVHVVGRFYSLPVSGATVLTFLPDSTNETVRTDSEGNATLVQLPPGNYSLRVAVPYGVQSLLRTSVAGPANISVAVFSIAELLTLIIPPITAAVAVVFVAVRREHARRVAMPTMPFTTPFPTTTLTAYCGACGKLLGPAELFCMTCGTPRAGSPQPSPAQQLPPSSSAPSP
ncbi:MAG TPA: carboxypeptidase-like regulatory domain-containing protein [Candidatus Bathyarchaeia archaeon]|nr:carboxypeptidase-like regulatory domain-containing protein [Candidatus Bathyarchaeia archaeon]